MRSTEARGAALDRLSRPMRDLRISVIDSCNFRCPYCMPAEVFGEDYTFLRRQELLTFTEMVRLARIFASFGVVKIKLTGGEPLLRPWLPELVRMLRTIDGIEDIGLITNGALLAGLVQPLKASGLGRLTVSLDSLDEATFARLSGRGHRLAQVLEAIAAAERAGFGAMKLNMVVQRGINDHEVVDMVRRFRHTLHIVRFIEYMDVGNLNGWSPERVVPSRETLARVARVFPVEPLEPNYRGEVARRYRFLDGSGEIGFISSITQPFCGGCSRVRLSADGKLYTCLFARSGTDLKGPLRAGADDREIARIVEETWSMRRDRYSEERGAAPSGGGRKIEMFHIGG